MKSGIDKQMVPGLNKLVDGLGGPFSTGLYDLLNGFTNTDFAEGYSGIVKRVNTFPEPPSNGGGNTGIIDGLRQIRLGLANPEFSPNPGGDPGVSDAVGLMIDGINTEVQGGIEQLKSGITDQIMPGLEEMNEGIKSEMQPGFSKVSVLLLVIWLASLIVVLVVGILIGRGRKARVSAGQSASM